MNSGIVKGFFKFYPGIFHKKRSFAGIFRVIGDGELFFCDSKGEVTLGKIKRGDLRGAIPPFVFRSGLPFDSSRASPSPYRIS